MKQLLYYSPFIPIVGFIIHFFWIVFEYDIYSIEENSPKCYIPILVQVPAFIILIFHIINK